MGAESLSGERQGARSYAPRAGHARTRQLDADACGQSYERRERAEQGHSVGSRPDGDHRTSAPRRPLSSRRRERRVAKRTPPPNPASPPRDHSEFRRLLARVLSSRLITSPAIHERVETECTGMVTARTEDAES